MDTIDNLRDRAKKIRGAFLPSSVTNEEVGLLLLDIINFIYTEGGGGSSQVDGNYWSKDEIKFLDQYLIVLEDKIKANFADNAKLWDEALFEDYIDQAIRTQDNVRFKSVLTDFVKTISLEATKSIKTETLTATTIATPDFVSGFGGSGSRLKDNHLELDELTVRRRMNVFEVLIQQIKSIGGQLLLTLGGVKITQVQEFETGYKCLFDNESDSVPNPFVVADQAIHQVYTGENINRYWRLVTQIGSNYFILSKTDSEQGSGIPQVGDEVVQCGHRTDRTRQNAIMISSYGDDTPHVAYYSGINNFSFSGKEVMREGNLDGIVDADFGQLKGFGLYAQNVFLKGTLRLMSGKDAEESINEVDQKVEQAAADLEFYRNSTNETLETLHAITDDLQSQVDGNIMAWEGSDIPTLSNYPGNEWITDTEKARHKGDYYDRLFYQDGVRVAERYKFSFENNAYKWLQIADSSSALALQEAREALGLAGTKARLFYGDATPTSPYDINDIWLKVNGDQLISKAKRLEGYGQNADDWQVVNTAQSRLAQIASDNVISKEEKPNIRNEKSQIDKEYVKYQADATKYGVSIVTLKTAYDALVLFLNNTVKISENSDFTFSGLAQQSQFNQLFADYYAARTDFSNIIANKISGDAIDNLKVGDVNLLNNSGKGWKNSNYDTAMISLGDYKPKQGEECTIVVKGKFGTGKTAFSFHNSGGSTPLLSLDPSNFNSDGIASRTFKWNVGSSANTHIVIFAVPGSITTESEVEWVKLVVGNKTSLQWSPSQNDTNNQIADAKKAGTDAQAAIDLMNDDNVFDIPEKQSIRTQWETIQGASNTTSDGDASGSYKKTIAMAGSNVSTTSLTTLYTTLRTFLNSVQLYTNSNYSPFVRATMATHFKNYFNEEVAVLDKVNKGYVDNLQIGVTNLVLNSDFRDKSQWRLWVQQQPATSFSTSANIATVSFGANGIIYCNNIQFLKGESYTLSADIKSDNLTTLDYNYIIAPVEGNQRLDSVAISSTWKRVSLTFKPTLDRNGGVGFGSTKAGVIQIKNVSLVNGDKDTGWLLSPIDSETRITQAKSAADDAQSSANAANALLSDIASDNKLTASEKQATKEKWDTIVSEKPIVTAQGETYGLSTTAYTNAYNALNTYITPLLANLTTTSDIVGTTFRTKFKDYYDAKTALLKAVSDKAKQLTSDAQNTANSAVDDVKTVTKTVAEIQADSEKIKLSVSTVTEKISTGGRNFATNSNNFIAGYPDTGITSTKNSDGSITVTKPAGTIGNYLFGFYNGNSNNIENAMSEGDDFVISFEIKSENSVLIPSIYIKSGMGYFPMSGKMSSSFSQVYYVGKWKKTNGIGFHLGFGGAVGIFTIRNMKVEKGSIPTSWELAPEDTETKIADAKKAGTDAQTAINAMNDDNVFDIPEKQSIRTQWEAIQGVANTTSDGDTSGSYKKTIAMAGSNVSTASLTTLYTTLRTFLNSVQLYTNSNYSPFVRATMAVHFKNYFNEEVAVLDKVSKGYVDAVQISDINLLDSSNKGWENNSYLFAIIPFGNYKPKEGEELTIVIKGELGEGRTHFGIYNSGGNVSPVSILKSEFNSDGIARKTFKWKIKEGTIVAPNTNVTIYNFPSSATSTSKIEWVKLVSGNKTSLLWSPSLNDTNNSINQAKTDAIAKGNEGKLFLRGTGGNQGASRQLIINNDGINRVSNNRGLALVAINRADFTIKKTAYYDTYVLTNSPANALATELNSYDNSVIVCLTSQDDAYTNWTQNLTDAIARCGGSGTKPLYRVPYAFVGIPGLGKGKGIEVITGALATDPFAEISTQVLNGMPSGIGIAQVVRTEINVGIGKIESTVTSIDNRLGTVEKAGYITKAGGQTLFASKTLEDGSLIASYINQDANNIRIQASKIEISGQTVFKDGSGNQVNIFGSGNDVFSINGGVFKVDKYGKATMNNCNIVGGKFMGFDIMEGMIQTPDLPKGQITISSAGSTLAPYILITKKITGQTPKGAIYVGGITGVKERYILQVDNSDILQTNGTFKGNIITTDSLTVLGITELSSLFIKGIKKVTNTNGWDRVLVNLETKEIAYG